MVDIVDRRTRSRMMSGIRGKNTRPEITVRKYLHSKGFRYRLHGKRLPGRPDLVLAKYRTAVFVHGCFWHQHPGCKYAYKPKSNRDFWRKKLASNIRRDKENQKQLRKLGWRVYLVWECRLRDSDLNKLARMVKQKTALR
jgi:DNA mismatch endonuclease, patch repair protein